MSSAEKDAIVPNIVTEVNSDGEGSSQENRARNRMVAEGYKYHALNNNGHSDVLDPIEDEATRTSRRRWQKVLMILALAVIMMTCLVVVIVIQHVKSIQMEEEQACSTPECVTSAAYILNKMDSSVDPCDDFYQFSCGNWVKTTPIPPSKFKYGAFQQIAGEIEVILKEIMESQPDTYKGVQSTAVHKTSMFYSLCVDEATVDAQGIEPALRLINDLGSWSFTSDQTSGIFNAKTWNIQDALLLAHQRGFSPLFTFDVGVDSMNNSQYVLQMEQAGLSLADSKQYFPNETKYQELKDAFLEFSKETVKLFGAKNNIEAEVSDLYAFQQKLAKIHVSRADVLDPVKSYNKMTLKEFQENYIGHWFNVMTFVNGLYKEIQTVSEDTVVVVTSPAYFSDLEKIINETEKRTLANYMVWVCLEGLLGYLPSSFLKPALILDKAESGIKEYDERWKRCLSKTSAVLGFAMGALYVEKHFAEDNKKEVDSLFEAIRSAFIKNLHSVDWMDDKTRNYAEEKAKAINKMLGYPDFVGNPTSLDQHYENLILEEGKFFESKLATMRYYKLKNLKRLGTVPDRTEWSMKPTEVNAYYSMAFNQIVFPAGILRPPLFNMDKPKSFNFGSFGMICGHELTHGFDNKGRNFDKNGNMNNWWSNSSVKSFEEKTRCFVNFYSNYEEDGTHLDGQLTLSENIADNGGMKMAYLAYQHWLDTNKGDDSFRLPGIKYTPDQLFFIGMAQLWCSHYTPAYMQKAILIDVHSIAKYRVLGTMSNSWKFSEAYSCPKNSPMNPEHKCSVW